MAWLIHRDKNKDNDSLMHYGVKGQKWGERNYQNEDGSYTPEGLRRLHERQKERKKRQEAERSQWKADYQSLAEETARSRKIDPELQYFYDYQSLSDEIARQRKAGEAQDVHYDMADLTEALQKRQKMSTNEKVDELNARKGRNLLGPSGVKKEYSANEISEEMIAQQEELLKELEEEVNKGGRALYDAQVKADSGKEEDIAFRDYVEKQAVELRDLWAIENVNLMNMRRAMEKKISIENSPPLDPTGMSSGASPIDWDKKQEEMNQALRRQNKNMGKETLEKPGKKKQNRSTKNTTYMKQSDSFNWFVSRA